MPNELKESPPPQKTTPATKGWPPERRAAQSARARTQKPWLHSTGPRSHAGKRHACRNSLKHGRRSTRMAKLLKLLAAQKRFLAQWRAGRYHPARKRLQKALRQGALCAPLLTRMQNAIKQHPIVMPGITCCGPP